VSRAPRPAPAAPARRGKEAAPLTAYRRKRDFSVSPEPAGEAVRPRRGKPLFFCIQKHLASHLHYDFRLEHRGVLLSWAVPKGPSPDPAVKRLAMRVEDHPLAYGTFEGVIPSGYGAGIVVLWDRGAWQPLVEDVDAALRRGNLPFLLLAEKLAGAWTLIRAGRAGPNAWLLLKQRDDWASAIDVTTRFPGSVASPGDFAEVLARQRTNPWPHDPPVKGGETGALFRRVLAQAARLTGSVGGKPGRRRPARS
jgi:bifunctional non-homologous end joining protein LigD